MKVYSGESGPVFWNQEQKEYVICFGCWNDGNDLMNPNCYGKAIRIPHDNGMKNHITIVPIEEATDYEWVTRMRVKSGV